MVVLSTHVERVRVPLEVSEPTEDRTPRRAGVARGKGGRAK
jgi:hypothetical protein